MESLFKHKKIIHLAGIVPVAGQPMEYNFPWPDAMIPIAPNYLAIERAVFECAAAGCESVWVVAYKGTQPLLRSRLGDYVTDPRSMSAFKKYRERRNINIYYVPVLPRDKYKRDSLGWSVLHGADAAFRVSSFLSKWVIPEKYYCAIPYGITDDVFIRSKRLEISDVKKTIFTFNNKTIKDNLPISFTFNASDYIRCRDLVKQRKFDEWYLNGEDPNDNKKVNESKGYSLSQIFSGLDISDANMIELPWFYDITTWSGYTNFLSSEHSKTLEKKMLFFPNTKRKIFASTAEIKNAGSINLEYAEKSAREYDDEPREETTDT